MIDLDTIRRYCRTNPHRDVSIPTREMLELLDRLVEAETQRDALREHLVRCHGCVGECAGGEE